MTLVFVGTRLPQGVVLQYSPERDQVTPLFCASFCTVAVKLAGVPVGTVAVDGATLTEIGAVTVKPTPLLATPPTVTTTFPVVAPLGTVVVILVALQVPTVAAVPLNVTEPLP